MLAAASSISTTLTGQIFVKIVQSVFKNISQIKCLRWTLKKQVILYEFSGWAFWVWEISPRLFRKGGWTGGGGGVLLSFMNELWVCVFFELSVQGSFFNEHCDFLASCLILPILWENNFKSGLVTPLWGVSAPPPATPPAQIEQSVQGSLFNEYCWFFG